MSGILKSIGRVVKKVFKSKIFKAVLIAAAIYFTAGVGLAAMGSTFAASLPGITAVGQAIGLAGVGEIAAAGATMGATAAAEVAASAVAAEAAGAAGAGATVGLGQGVTAAGTAASAAGAGAAASSPIWGGVNATARQIITDGVIGMGKTVLSAWGQSDANEQRKDEFEFHKKTREVNPFTPTPVDIKMPSITDRPSIINSALDPNAAQAGAGLSQGSVAGRQLQTPQTAAPQPADVPPTGAAPFDPNRLKKSQFTQAGA